MDPNLVVQMITAVAECVTEILRGIPLDIRQEQARQWNDLLQSIVRLVPTAPAPPAKK